MLVQEMAEKTNPITVYDHQTFITISKNKFLSDNNDSMGVQLRCSQRVVN